ncbi:MAG: RIP metalloprotease RseP [Deltaproteobacteria bacterium]|nr:MAG: RIP metalloprotease RseP [Deltaproteobacteria bacterium]
MTSLSFIFAFVAMLGVLVFVHEFGHFFVAKLCGVRVVKFSIGFGPPIGVGRFRLRWERGGTEYVIAWIPLGGFVRILGEHAEEDSEEIITGDGTDHLGAKPLWQKLAIYFAGPAMNLALPVLIFAGMFAVGMMRPLPVVGSVEPESPAQAAGFQVGDRILSVDDEPVRWWDEVETAVRERGDDRLRFRVSREAEEIVLPVRVAQRRGMDPFGGVEERGWVGLGHARLSAKIGIPASEAPARSAGLRSGDVVIAVAGEAVEGWAEFARRYAGAGTSGEVELRVARGRGEEAAESTLRIPALGSVGRLGVVPATVLIGRVSPDSPAQRAGLEAGDLLLSVDGAPVGSFGHFAETVRTSEGRALQIAYARDGETRSVAIAPELIETDTGLGIDEERYMIGITADAASLPGAFEPEVQRNPFVSIPRAVVMTVDQTRTYLRGLGKLLTGEVSRKQLAGPIGIGVIAHNALQQGLEVYLAMMVIISINLGILNLLPIPVLDGGQILLFTVEGIKRSPVSLRTREVFQQVGIAVIVLLMGFAFWNDFSRYWGKFIEYVRETAGL